MMQYLRGDRSAADVIDVEEFAASRGTSEPTASNLDVLTAEVSHLSDVTNLLSEGQTEGTIDGVHYISAWTCGDGACGLHAVFGLCRDGQLYAPDIRTSIFLDLPTHLADLMERLPSQASKDLLQKLLHNLWRELKDYAEVLQDGNVPDVEARILWSACSIDVQNDMLGFLSSRRMEGQKESALRTALMDFARTLFQPENEELIVRPLCVHLDYLLPNAPDHLYSQYPDPNGALTLFEGSRGSLNLLHPCAE